MFPGLDLILSLKGSKTGRSSTDLSITAHAFEPERLVRSAQVEVPERDEGLGLPAMNGPYRADGLRLRMNLGLRPGKPGLRPGLVE